MRYSGITIFSILFGLNLVVWSSLSGFARKVEAPRLFGAPDFRKEVPPHGCEEGFFPECTSLFGAFIGQVRHEAVESVRSHGCENCSLSTSDATLKLVDQREVQLKEGWVILSEAEPDPSRRVELFSFGDSVTAPIHGIRATIEFTSEYPQLEQVQAELFSMFGSPGPSQEPDDVILKWSFDADGRPKNSKCPVSADEQCVEVCPTSLDLFFGVADHARTLEYFRPRYSVCNTFVEAWISQAEQYPGKVSSVTVDIIDFDLAIHQLGSRLALE